LLAVTKKKHADETLYNKRFGPVTQQTWRTGPGETAEHTTILQFFLKREESEFWR
jgi:hypothetical protein